VINNDEKHLILIELNEINFDIVEKYIRANAILFPSLNILLSGKRVRTSSEKKYEELEPWIQWASVHTCKSYAEHGIFRLGDIVGSGIPQIFDQIERAGYRVGAISAMNAENRLSHPSYFIPDPWTQTHADPSWWSQSLGQAVAQVVNDNSQARITPKSAMQVTLGLLRFARVGHYKKYLSLVATSRRKPWLKALVLDLLLHDVHLSLFDSKKPNFSTLFLNAGAHIQHHYFFNADPIRKYSLNKNPSWYVAEEDDPLADVLSLYDMIVGEYLNRNDVELIVATGLSQKPYDRIEFYYRLKSHANFLNKIGISFNGIYPRMTRDFLIEFDCEQQALQAEHKLANVLVGGDDAPLFGEIDNRGTSLFVTLTYPNEITDSTFFSVGDRKFPLMSEVSFVAIKNGMHQEEGFAFFSPVVALLAPIDKSHVAELGKTILRFFGVKPGAAENALIS
jgi:hypothetical protein